MAAARTTAEAEPRPVVVLECYSWLCRELGMATGDRGRVEVPFASGETVQQVLDRLAAESEPFARHVFDRDMGRVKESVAVLLNGRHLDLTGGIGATLHPGDEVLILPGFSGG